MLQRGAARVAAVDVAYGQIDPVAAGRPPRDRDRAAQRPRNAALATFPSRPSFAAIDVSFISLAKVLPAVVACLGARAASCWRWSSRSSSSAASGSARASCATRATAARRSSASPRPPAELGLAVLRLRALGAARAEGQPRDLRLVRRARARGIDDLEAAIESLERRASASGSRDEGPRRPDHPLAPAGGDRGGRRSRSPPRRDSGWRIVATRGRAGQARRRSPSGSRRRRRGPRGSTSAWCSAATARSCTRCAASPAPASPSSASTSAPSASSPRSSARRPSRGIRRAFAGEIETIDLPGLEIEIEGGPRVGLNDIGFSRRPEDRVAELSYKIAGEEVGHVRCDGLVASTPVGSTGYNLANQGPILAWGVKGYVVSYISPHSLTARALVVAPGDVLHVGNAPGREPVDVAVDGEPTATSTPAPSSRSASPTTSAASPSSPGRASTSASARSSGTSPSRAARAGAPASLGCSRHGAQMVDPGPDLDRDVHAAAGHHGRQRRPARHPARTGRQPLQPAVGGRRLHADARRLPAHRRLARRPAWPPPRLLDRLRRSSPSPRSSAGSPATRPCSTSPAACRGSAPPAMFATSLALIGQEFHGKDRATAFGVWGATIGGAVAIGPAGRRRDHRAPRLGVDLLRQRADRAGGDRPDRDAGSPTSPPKPPSGSTSRAWSASRSASSC